MPPAVLSGAFESAERAQIAAPDATCSSSFICWEGRAEERGGERGEALWIKCERDSRVWRRDRSGALYSYATKWIGGFSLCAPLQQYNGDDEVLADFFTDSDSSVKLHKDE